jgi:regulator of sirC expression with transglutaminase-like and TPR domain
VRFCFNLDRARLEQRFAPEAIAAIAQLVDLDPETPERLTDDWLLPRLA